MGRSLALVVALGAVLAVAPRAHAQMMGDTMAATGVHGALASTGTMNAAGTIGGVKRALGAAVDQKHTQLASVDHSWGGKHGGKSSWMINDGTGKGWGNNLSGKAWSDARNGKGWSTADARGGKGWASGSWKD